MCTASKAGMKLVLQELVDLFNFHRFDNMRHSEKKLDPRRESFEVRREKFGPEMMSCL